MAWVGLVLCKLPAPFFKSQDNLNANSLRIFIPHRNLPDKSRQLGRIFGRESSNELHFILSGVDPLCLQFAIFRVILRWFREYFVFL
jgi:hypothetical protein